MKFEWDARKDRANLEKHGVSFAERALCLAMPWPHQFLIPTIPRAKLDL
jgi:uncharacterized DUF497 family protein